MANYQEARSKDLSQGGLALVEMAHLENGDLLKVEIELPGRDKPIKAYSEVMWIKPPGAAEADPLEIAGIKFMGLREEDEEYLEKIIAAALEESEASQDDAARLDENAFIKKMGQRFK